MELLSPSRCSACDDLLRQRAVFCPTCASSVIRATESMVRARHRIVPVAAYATYGGSVADALRLSLIHISEPTRH